MVLQEKGKLYLMDSPCLTEPTLLRHVDPPHRWSVLVITVLRAFLPKTAAVIDNDAGKPNNYLS